MSGTITTPDVYSRIIGCEAQMERFDFSRKSEGLLGEPTLPRKRLPPSRLEVGAGAPSYRQTA